MTRDEYLGSYIATIGVDFDIKTVQCLDKTVKMQMWDTAGQDRFRSITTSYYRGAHAIVVVCDVTDMDSFRNVPHWLEEVRRYASPDVQLMIVANKTDQIRKRVVEKSDLRELSQALGIPVVEASAKTAQGVNEAFMELTTRYVETVPDEDPKSDPVYPVFAPASTVSIKDDRGEVPSLLCPTCVLL